MMWFIPDFDNLIHIALGALAIASVVRFQYQRAAGIAFHTITGLIQLIWPSLLYGPLVSEIAHRIQHRNTNQLTLPVI